MGTDHGKPSSATIAFQIGARDQPVTVSAARHPVRDRSVSRAVLLTYERPGDLLALLGVLESMSLREDIELDRVGDAGEGGGGHGAC